MHQYSPLSLAVPEYSTISHLSLCLLLTPNQGDGMWHLQAPEPDQRAV